MSKVCHNKMLIFSNERDGQYKSLTLLGNYVIHIRISSNQIRSPKSEHYISNKLEGEGNGYTPPRISRYKP